MNVSTVGCRHVHTSPEGGSRVAGVSLSPPASIDGLEELPCLLRKVGESVTGLLLRRLLGLVRPGAPAISLKERGSWPLVGSTMRSRNDG